MMRDQPADSIWTVSGLNRYIRTALETDYRLKDLIVVGEISNLSRPASGHLYFTLKDQSAAIRCVMWKAQAARLIYRPREGDRVQAHGAVGVYEAGGQYQLYADWLQAEGGGDLFREFNALKARLEAEGLFDPSRKRPLPAVPARIAIVTSPSGAALRDMLNVIRRRWPALEVILCPTPVQGDDAPYGIVQALAAANSLRPDLIIIARGGGSMEDLWAFNDEGVVRAIAASGLPVVSGVGHETDFTLADFAADLRAPTPSAAAELATPDRAQFLAEVQARVERLTAAMQLRIRERRWALSGRLSALRGLSPRAILVNSRQRLDDLTERAAATARHTLELRRHRLDGLHLRLAALSPLSILNRGYAIVTRAGTTDVIRSASAVHPGDELDVRVSQGRFEVTVASPRRHKDTKGHEGNQDA